MEESNSNESSIKEKIGIYNYSKSLVYIRISAVGGGSDEFFPLDCGSGDSWCRQKGNHHMEVSLTSVPNSGRTVVVQTGLFYYIQDDLTVETTDGQPIPFSSDIFSSSFFTNNEFQTNKTANITGTELDIEKPAFKISFYNNTSNTIYVRVKSSGFGSEDLFPLMSSQSDAWGRDEGIYLAEIVIDEEKKFRFLVQSPCEYTFTNENALVNNQTGDCVVPTNENTFSISELDIEKPAFKISFSNETSNTIYVRVKSSGFGSEDLFPLMSSKCDAWGRDEGIYLAEIVIDEEKKFRFLVQSPCEYTFTNENALVNNQTGDCVVPTTDNTFN